MPQQPAVALLLCLAAVALAGHAAASSYLTADVIADSAYRHTRRILAQSAAEQQSSAKPQCFWSDNKCYPSRDNWLVSTGMPASPLTKAELVGRTRDRHCTETYKDKAACWKDRKNRCWWTHNDGQGECRGADYSEVSSYSATNFRTEFKYIPTAMTCPGTKAAEYFSCYAHPDPYDKDGENCSRLGKCYFARVEGGPACLPTWIRGYTPQQFYQLSEKLLEFDPALWGKCARVCWMKQAKQCLTVRTKEQGCRALPYCRWDSGSGCAHSELRPGDKAGPSSEKLGDFDRKVMGLYASCQKATSKQACEASNNPKALQTSIDWKSYVAPSADVKCSL